MKQESYPELRALFKSKTTEELVQIWTENHRETWRDEAFEIIRLILIERGAPIPPQTGPIPVAKMIKETKNTCKACGKVWFYGKEDVQQQKQAAMENAGKAMMCCGGCLPALFLPDKKQVDLSKCPDCGSKAVVSEEVIHKV